MADVFRYEVIPSASWAYLSTILMVSIYFKFNRILCVRNLDILMLALLAPGLLIVQHGQSERLRLEPKVRPIAQQIQKLQQDIEKAAEKPAMTKVEKVEESPKKDPEPAPSPPAKEKELIRVGGDSAPPETNQETTVEETEDKKEESEEEKRLSSLNAELTARTGEILALKKFESWGYICLFVAGGALLIRMLVDPFMIRRPLLEPNLEFSGLTFLTIVLLVFLIANIVTASVAKEDINAAESGKNLATAKATDPTRSKGPGYQLLFLFPVIPTFVADEPELNGEKNGGFPDVTPFSENAFRTDASLIVVAKTMAIFGQLAIVLGIYLIGFLHFGNSRTGIGVVTLYLLLPYTAEMTGRIIHILPSAALVWAVVCYRKPMWSGAFIGLAMGLAYYPIYLLPLWLSFYWHRGLRQFLIGFLAIVIVLTITMVFTSSDLSQFWQNLRAMFGMWAPLMDGLTGFWDAETSDSSYRIPVMSAFLCLSVSFAAWPARKDLGTLLSCSAALMLAVQFWHGFGGGLLMAWYLPLTLLAMFRPNLEDRTAVALSLDRKGRRVSDVG